MHAPAWLVRWLAGAAALVRAFARLLERVAGGGAAPEAAMQALAARFPGAPDHWLQVIAERAPHLAEGPPQEPLDMRAPPPPPLRPMAPPRRSWPSRRWRGEDPAASALDASATLGETLRPERRAAGLLFQPFARRRRSASTVAEPRRRAPGWTAAFEPASPHPPAPTPTFDPPSHPPARGPVFAPHPAGRRTPLTVVGADVSSAHPPADWTATLRETASLTRPVFPARPGHPAASAWPALQPLQAEPAADRGWSEGRPSSKQTETATAPVRPASCVAAAFTPERSRATSAPAFDPSPRRRRTDAPRAPTPHAWPTLPPAAAPEIEEADAASPRLRDLAFEQERGLWSG